jgi:hypothetical protein
MLVWSERPNGRSVGYLNGEIATWNHSKYNASATPTAAAADAASAMLGAAQNHEILNWVFCNNIGCVPI